MDELVPRRSPLDPLGVIREENPRGGLGLRKVRSAANLQYMSHCNNLLRQTSSGANSSTEGGLHGSTHSLSDGVNSLGLFRLQRCQSLAGMAAQGQVPSGMRTPKIQCEYGWFCDRGLG